MNAQDLYEGLLTTGYPVAYRAFKDGPKDDADNLVWPYICYLFVGSADFMADDSNYHGAGDYQVELYTEVKDLEAEAVVEAALVTLGLSWSKTEAYLDTEDMYEILYEVRLIDATTMDESI